MAADAGLEASLRNRLVGTSCDCCGTALAVDETSARLRPVLCEGCALGEGC